MTFKHKKFERVAFRTVMLAYTAGISYIYYQMIKKNDKT